jgi:hypothetical protein
MQKPVTDHFSRRGSAMVQCCLAALPLLLLGSVVIEATQWHATRQRLALAVQRTTHDASLDGGTGEALKTHLQRHLPRDLRMPIQLCITDPVGALMSDFLDARLSAKLGKAVIRHNHLGAQHGDSIAKGRPQGIGPKSKQDIFQANRLNIEVRANYRPASTWVRKLIGSVTIHLRHQAIMQSHRQRTSMPCITLN